MNDIMFRTNCSYSDDECLENTTLHYCDIKFIDTTDVDEEKKIADVKLRLVYPFETFEDSFDEMEDEDGDLGCYFKFLIHKKLEVANVVCLQRLYLDKEYRGKGYGSYILDTILDKAIDKINPLLGETSYIIVGVINPDKDIDDTKAMTDQIVKMLEDRDFKVENFGNDLYFYKEVSWF